MRPEEVAVQRNLTRAFRDADVESVALQRVQRSPDGAGGWKATPPLALPPQAARLIPSNSSRSVEKTSLDGSVLEPDGTLFGDVDLDVEEHDTFTLWGVDWRVVRVRERTAYSVKADVIRHGR